MIGGQLGTNMATGTGWAGTTQPKKQGVFAKMGSIINNSVGIVGAGAMKAYHEVKGDKSLSLMDSARLNRYTDNISGTVSGFFKR